MGILLQHPSAKAHLPQAWQPFATVPGIAAPKLWICSHCRISLVLRSKPACIGCGRPMKVAK